MYCDKENVNILTSHLVERGVRHIVVCPGSRNAPLVHNFAQCDSIECHPVTDERSAAFVALGIAQTVDSPVAVCVTSGSALLGVLPGVAEATYQHQGIIVISADRPAAWIGQLDGQTMPQPGALGQFVGHCVSLPEPHDDTERWLCHRLINEAFLALEAAPHASVHINVPISEPLFEFTTTDLPKARIVRRETRVESIVQLIHQARRPMVVVAQRPHDEQLVNTLAGKVVVLAEVLGAGSQQLNLVDQMLYVINGNADAYKPDVLIYLGGHTVSKRLRHFMRSLPDDTCVVMVSEDGTLHDVSQHTSIVLQANATRVLESIAASMEQGTPFVQLWGELYRKTLDKHNQFEPHYSQMLAVKLFEQKISDDIVYYANSTAVRLGSIYATHYCRCNRGLNGIEGSLSVAAGAALATSDRVYCVTGDLSFFYDENALWQRLPGNLRILLLNNSQGGIFRQLKGLEQSPVRDTFVSGRHSTSAQGVCGQMGVEYLRADDPASLAQSIDRLITMESDRPVLLEVMTDVDTDEREFKRYYHDIKQITM